MEAIFILSAYNYCLGLLSSLVVTTNGQAVRQLDTSLLKQENAAISMAVSSVSSTGGRAVHTFIAEQDRSNTLDTATAETSDTTLTESEDGSENELQDTYSPEDSEPDATDESYDCAEQSDSSDSYDNIGYDTDAVCFSPGFDSTFKAYMDYRCITDTGSDQYMLQQQAYTDSRGFRRIGDDYCVALGTGLTYGCGQRFLITLDSGYSFTAIVSDVKADIHTDSTNCYAPRGENAGNIVEFIIDTDNADGAMLNSGSADCFDDLSGNVISVQGI